MYVCLCEAVSDRTIQKAINSGCDTVKKIRDQTGAARQCCKCVAEIQQMIKTDDATNNSGQSLFFHQA